MFCMFGPQQGNKLLTLAASDHRVLTGRCMKDKYEEIILIVDTIHAFHSPVMCRFSRCYCSVTVQIAAAALDCGK